MKNPVNQAIDLITHHYHHYISAGKKNVLHVFASQCLYETLRLRDVRISNHSLKVGIYAYLLATKMDSNHAIEYFLGGLVHDIGKIAFPDAILNGEKLEGKKREKIKEHVVNAESILSDLQMSKIIINIAKYHHERQNGTGYPKGVQGDFIPIEGKIAAVADVYTAITEQDRGYQAGRSHHEAFQILMDSKEQFDPLVLQQFFNMFHDVNSIKYVNEMSKRMLETIFSFEKYLDPLALHSRVSSR
ncbi:HD-GYP domain-containing protein [Bacillus sp. FJAT-28004]|uniref:HD-GYP domain-containing protein n=1 Tax=Bacillus sp. FJAT-28004 TaxID=1679165 RepID=UPI0006B6262E|nr:HD domain-containing phosphohydrolase [Bacillus sp. FJAT-28004]